MAEKKLADEWSRDDMAINALGQMLTCENQKHTDPGELADRAFEIADAMFARSHTAQVE